MHDKMFERSHVGLYVYDLTADSALYEYGKRQYLRPGSNQKVMTAASALSILGTDYKLQTRLYITSVTEGMATPSAAAVPQAEDAEFVPPAADPAEQAVIDDSLATIPPALTVADVKQGGSAQIIIKGGMDPLLGPDDLRAFAQALRDRGITTIKRNIVCDATFKDTDSMGWGWCWDDDYVPLTPFLYLGEAGKFDAALRSALKKAGITFTGRIVHGLVPKGAELLLTRSHTIDQVLGPMMKKSDNLFAECLFYHLAAKSGKAGATHKDAAAKVGQFIKTVGLNPADYNIADGSGLSLYNYLSPELLVDVLRYVYRHQDLYDHLYPSLPIMGRDGTLAKRCVGKSAQDRVHAKTGTVRGVSALSGYATAPNGHLLAFSIINQGIPTASVGRNFQDRVCCALTRPVVTKTIEPDALPDKDSNEEEVQSENEEIVEPEITPPSI